MIAQVINSERIKMTTTKSPYWCVAIVAVIVIGVGVLVGVFSKDNSHGSAADVNAAVLNFGMQLFGYVILMVMAILSVTSEFRYGTIRTTFQAVPNRSSVLFGKAVVMGGLAAVVSLVTTVIAIVVGRLLLPASLRGDVALGAAETIRQYWATPVFVFLAVLLALGVGAIVRQSVGAIVVVLIWALVLESVVSAIPKVKDATPYLPFTNGLRILSDKPNSANVDYPWNMYGSLIYFAVWAVAVFGVGLYLTNKRDA